MSRVNTKEIGVALLGFGTVGAGVVETLQKNGSLLAARLGVLSVTDQGMAHTVDPATAYPYCTNTVAAPIAGEPPLCTAGDIFGFTKLRLKVRNDTPALTESGSTAAAIAQDMATTLAAPGPTDPRLVAVARYHRNRCYDAGLQGESVVDYAGTVTTPFRTKSPKSLATEPPTCVIRSWRG